MSKPRIKKEWSFVYRDYIWFCRGQRMKGMGFTAKEAYDHWQWVCPRIEEGGAMSLPLPPPAVQPSELLPNSGGVLGSLYTADQMQAYGQACRAAALEEAALAAFDAPVKTYRQDTRDACANAIRSLK